MRTARSEDHRGNVTRRLPVLFVTTWPAVRDGDVIVSWEVTVSASAPPQPTVAFKVSSVWPAVMGDTFNWFRHL